MLTRLRAVVLTVAVVAASGLLASCTRTPPPKREVLTTVTPAPWFIGTWEGTQVVPFGTANVRIVFEEKEGPIHWRREFLTGPYANSARASGLATISADQVNLELTGSYDPNPSFHGVVKMSLKRIDDKSLKGTVVGGDGSRNDIAVHKK